jgi:hypothetical protein
MNYVLFPEGSQDNLSNADSGIGWERIGFILRTAAK